MSDTAERFVDIYVLPVPADRIHEYAEQASLFGRVVRDCGGLSYREFRGTALGRLAEAGDGEVLTTAVAGFTSEALRDEVMGRVMEDPRVREQLEGEEVANMSRMNFGGFETFVEA